MSRTGPPLERLTHRLAECPEVFLHPPRRQKRGAVHVDAVVHDLLLALVGATPPPGATAPFRAAQARVPHLQLVLIAAWLLHDEWFRGQPDCQQAILAWLGEGLAPLAHLVDPELFVTDPERREELARLCLAALGFRPAGESENQASDRLTSLSTVHRQAILARTKAKEEKARKLREAMERRRAREAAAKAVRE